MAKSPVSFVSTRSLNDRPPSFMRILGLKWLLKILYPESYELDHVTETRNFFRLFLNVEISAQQAGKLFRPDRYYPSVQQTQ